VFSSVRVEIEGSRIHVCLVSIMSCEALSNEE